MDDDPFRAAEEKMREVKNTIRLKLGLQDNYDYTLKERV